MASCAGYRRGKSGRPGRSKIQQCSLIPPKAIASAGFRIRKDIYPDIFSEDFRHTEPCHRAAIGTIPGVHGHTDDPASIANADPMQRRVLVFLLLLQTGEN